MSDYSEHLISMAGGDGERDIATRQDGAAMLTTEQLDAIEARTKGIDSFKKVDESQADVPVLLSAVREQAVKLDAITRILDEWASFEPFPDADDTQRWYSLGKGHAASAIRTALEAS